MKSFFLSAITLLVCASCTPDTPKPEAELAPPLALKRLDGVSVSLDSLRGKIVLIDFWATWCTPCVREIPELNAVWNAHKDRGVELLAISVDTEPKEVIAKWVRDKGVLYPVALADLDLAMTYGAQQFPYHLVLGPDGTVRERLAPGYHDREELAEVLARHLP
ncbi:MAG: TlpA family protein disulfide reductase [bacterium]|nr:TlpA family protein disulfide reductase [bacterium]